MNQTHEEKFPAPPPSVLGDHGVAHPANQPTAGQPYGVQPHGTAMPQGPGTKGKFRGGERVTVTDRNHANHGETCTIIKAALDGDPAVLGCASDGGKHTFPAHQDQLTLVPVAPPVVPKPAPTFDNTLATRRTPPRPKTN